MASKCTNGWGRPTVLLVMSLVLAGSSGCSKDGSIVDVIAPRTGAGSSAQDLLSAANYTSLVVEIQPLENMQPTSQTIDNLTQFLETHLDKPDGVQVIVGPEIPSPGNTSYSIDQIRIIEAAQRTKFASGNTMAAYFLLVDADSDQSVGNFRILGHAYAATSMVIYESAIRELSGGIGQPSQAVLESTVINHEFGHILGLVGNGSPAVEKSHHDQPNGAHCTDTDCLMHFSVDTGDVVANLIGGNIPTLDAHCVSDLQNNGGK